MFRRFAEQRERLAHYLIEQAAETVRTDRPLMRALFFDHPSDQTAWDHPHQYLLGSELLINPVTEAGASSWQTYLPHGDWVDIWTHQTLTGSRVVRRDVPIDEIPVYCRRESWPTLGEILNQ